jgi:RHS repeat-associated protein
LVVEANGHKFEHDMRNAIRKEQWEDGCRWFHRDARDQLVRIELYHQEANKWRPAGVWAANYDGLNRRVSKSVYGDTTTFYWDNDRLAAEVLPEGKLRIYIYADALAMTPVLFVDYASVDVDPASGTVYAVFSDHLACPERIEDMAGNVVWAAKIAPYGKAYVFQGQDFHQPLRWPGHYFDAELRLHYNRFRTYSPEIGRYYEPDPWGLNGGLENVYAYTINPLYRVDTHGLGCPGGKGKKGSRAARRKAKKEARRIASDRKKITRLSNQETAGALAKARAMLLPYVKKGAWQAVVDRLDVSSPKDGAYFWSGDKKAAKAQAEKAGGVIMETTPGGRVVDGWDEVNKYPWNDKSGSPPPYASDCWKGVSKKYADGASGDVNVVQSASKIPDGGEIWQDKERPALRKGQDAGRVGTITYHDVDGNVLRTEAPPARTK